MTWLRFTSVIIGLGLAFLIGWSIVSTERIGSRMVDQSPLVLAGLAGNATASQRLFDANCAACHGIDGAGSSQGPPLVHRIYEPSHHADMAFILAVRHGVRAHHWQFGNMPAIDGVSDSEIAQIVAYVRELQRAASIY